MNVIGFLRPVNLCLDTSQTITMAETYINYLE